MRRRNGNFAREYQLLDAYLGRQDQNQRKVLRTVTIPLPRMPTKKKIKYENVPKNRSVYEHHIYRLKKGYQNLIRLSL
jgi:hypothetical protein